MRYDIIRNLSLFRLRGQPKTYNHISAKMINVVNASPESIGLSSAVLEKTLRHLDGVQYINGIVMRRHGRCFLEAYWKPYNGELPHMLWSLSKSFTSCAVGIAQGEGFLYLDDHLVSFFPEYAAEVRDEKMKQATLRDLLTMRSGHEACAWGAVRQEPSGDYVRGFLAGELKLEPGIRFVYDNTATMMLSAVVQRVTGQTVREYLLPRLFRPMGIVPGIWESTPGGVNCGSFGLYLRTRDIAKFAQLLLDGGRYGDRQLVPSEYLAEATAKQADNSFNGDTDWGQGYGYQFWRSRHGFRGDGAAGQFAIVLPEYDLAVAVNSCTMDMGRVMSILWEELLPELQVSPLPEDGAALQSLRDYSAQLNIAPVSGDTVRRGDNRRWMFAPNAAAIRAASLEFGEEECALTFDTAHGPQQLRAGFGFHQLCSVRLQDTISHPVASSAAWNAAGHLVIESLFCDGTFRDRFEIDPDAAEFPLRWSTQCSRFRPFFPLLRVVPAAR